MENDATTRKNRLSARETSMTGLGIRPRTPPLSPSSQSYAGTDRLSVLSATATDLSDFSPSPTASIGSVRIATVTRVPCRAGDRRVSTGMASIASEDGYLSDASLTLRGMGASGERAIASSASRLDAEPELREDEFESGTKKHHESRAATRLATSKWQRGLSSSQNRLSSDEWAARPGSSQSSDHTGRQSMSILAPVTRVLSPPPWVEAHGDENVYPSAARPPRRKGLTASRSLDLLGKFRHPHSHDNEESKADRLTYNATTLKESTSSHKRSASEAPLSRISPANTSLVTARPLTPSLLESAVFSVRPDCATGTSGAQASMSASSSDGFPDVGAAGLRAYAEKRSDLDVSEYLEHGPRSVRQTPLEPSGLTSPAAIEVSPPQSTPAGVLLFARRGVSPSDSKMSLAFSATSSSTATPSPSTPAGLGALDSSPAVTGQDSYFTAVPGATSTGAFPGGFGHRLISLKEARQRESERSAAARRKAATTPPLEKSLARETGEGQPQSRSRSKGESLSSRRGMPAPDGLKSASNAAVLEAPSNVIKPKRSGFLRRMMGGGGGSSSSADKTATSPDQHALPESDAFRLGFACCRPCSPLWGSGPGGGGDDGHDGSDAILQLSTSTSPTLSLRPVSTAFSAGLPADFFAEPMLAPVAAGSPSPTWSWSHSSSPDPSLSPPLGFSPSSGAPLDLSVPRARSTTSPGASLRASTHGAAAVAAQRAGGVYEAFDMGGGPDAQDRTVPLERFVALQDEFDRAKSAWSAREQELEAQIRQLTMRLSVRESRQQPLRASSLGDPRQ
ncbi:hypothetical protein JCM8115_004815 [Rhodotorula mucilaginosa]